MAFLLLLLLAAPQEHAAPSFERDVFPLLDQYCSRCHEGEDAEKELDLLVFSKEAEALQHLARYQQAAWALWRDTMPPPSAKDRPTEAEIAALLRWVDEVATPLSTTTPPVPTLRRLNNREYENAAQDLFGVGFDAADFFPADNVSGGFDNIGSALAMSDMRFEKYVAAAKTIARTAIVVENPEYPPVVHVAGDETQGMRFANTSAVFYTNGAAAASVFLPRGGLYRIRVQAWGHQAGPDPCKVRLRYDGDLIQDWDVTATQDAPKIYEWEAILEGGEGKLTLSFLNDYYREKTENQKSQDRNLFWDWVEVVGPLDPPETTSFQKDLERRFPKSQKGLRIRNTLRHLAFQVWRKPLERTDLQRILKYADAESSWELAIQQGLEAILVSPRFLFALEPNPPRRELSKSVRARDPFELATGLSLFLWGSVPDETLLARAKEGALQSKEDLNRTITRMLRSPKSQRLARGFADQWLQVRNLKLAEVDKQLFPAFTPSLRLAMAEETLRLFEYVLRENRSVWELLDADYSFLNEELAQLYGISGVEGSHLRRVPYGAAARRGVLGHASILTVTSRATRTAPVLRGKWILENLLGSPLPPPPPGADSLSEESAHDGAASLRQQLEAHRNQPQCIACHIAMDPLGFGLEHYDPIGAWRDQAGPFPVDASGTLLNGQSFSGALELVQLLRQDDRFLRCLTEKLATYGLGRPMTPQDRPMLQKVLSGLDPERPTLQEILRGIIHSDAFRQRAVIRR